MRDNIRLCIVSCFPKRAFLKIESIYKCVSLVDKQKNNIPK